MANTQIQRLLEFASMQLAAEAFLTRPEDNVPNLPPEEQVADRLEDGNTHASRFTPLQGERFATNYQILAQYRNDPLKVDGSGFSGTLFKNRDTDELTLSFRSTEFIDDAVRDTKSAGELEIRRLGWAFGQIAEMEAWYAQLRSDPSLLGGKVFNVTGYSLGGHLATAFGILRREAFEGTGNSGTNPVENVYTFNGAGTGGIRGGRRLTDLLSDFNRIRADYAASTEWMSLQPEFKNSTLSIAQSRLEELLDEHVRVGGLSGVRAEIFGVPPPTGNSSLLGYQIAALLVARDTVGSSKFPFPAGVNWIPSEPEFVAPASRLPNLVEVVGMETNGLAASFVSNSGLHYGRREEIHIEDQPRFRGDFPYQVIRGIERLQGLNLLVNGPGENNFADSHSLVLIMDSLALMAAFERLDSNFTLETGGQILTAASRSRASSSFMTQGKAEGDTLERTLDSLRRLLLGSVVEPTPTDLRGNTWHDTGLREAFHQNLDEVNQLISENALEEKFRVVALAGLDSKFIASQASAAGDVGAAWRYALVNLNPFVLDPVSGTLPDQYTNAKNDLFDPVTNPNGLTVDYLADRAAMLGWKNQDSLANGQRVLRSNRIETYQFTDKSLKDANGADLTFTVLGTQAASTNNPVKIIFGSEASETLFGSDTFAGDRLYGGGNVDRLVGNGGNDYLEGNGANDTLEGGSGADVLVGGDGNDYLEGGVGFDTYIVGVGQDQIRDQDGSGLVLDSAGNRIAGRFTKQGSQYVFSAKPAITATFNSSFTITLENGATVVIEDFDEGKLGIHLSAQPDIIAPPNVLPQTNASDSFNFTFSNQAVTVRGLGGNDLVGVGVVPPGHPLPTQVGSVVEGGAGSDAVSGADGNDRLFGGISSDLTAILNGTAPTIPGTDREVVAGNKGDDVIVGGSGDDWLSGGRGEDEIYGGAGDDVIAGGGQIWTGSFWGSGGYLLPFTNIFDAPALAPGQVLPALQKTLLFNVHLTFQQSNELLLPAVVAAIEAAGRIVRGGVEVEDSEEGSLFVSLGGADFEDATDTIFAGAGNDEVWAGFGDDYVEGEAGADSITGGEGEDTLFGGADDDTLSGDTDDEDVAFDHHGADYLDGGEGNDTLVGHGGADTLFGGDGNDVLRGDADFLPTFSQGDDYLDGEAGNDVLFGHGGNDQLYGGDGNDELQGGLGDDHLAGEAGDDRLVAGAGADSLEADAGNDALFGEAGADTLVGGEGNDELDGGTEGDSLFGDAGTDVLRGGAGDDALTGGAGVDTLMGGAGNDLYLIGAGDGSDTINDTEDVNRIQFTGVFNPGELTISQVGTSSTLAVGYGADETGVLTIAGGLTGAIREFEFAEGTSYSLKQVLNLAQTGPITLSAQNATLVGGGGNDALGLETGGMLDGGRGDDVLTVGSGSTTLGFSLGDGDDLVQGNAAGATFVFDETIDADSLVFVRPDPADPRVTSQRDLILNYGEGDSIFIPDSPSVINYSYLSRGPILSHARLLERSGLELRWSGSSNDQSVSATRFDDQLSGEGGADTLRGAAGNDVLDGGSGIDTLEGESGNDTLVGGTGSDTLKGGDGDDRYFFNSGDGIDLVVDNVGTDTLEFGPGITLSDVTAEIVNGTDGNIYLAVGYTGGTVLVRQSFGLGGSPGAISFHFADDNSTSSSAALSSLKLVAPLNFRGASESIRISGGAFDDTLIGSTQDDRLEGGDGNDQLAGDAGSDFVAGGPGDDLLVGNAGDDTLDGGPGDDTYRLHGGMGLDRIIETGGGLNTIVLGPGLGLGDLSAQRAGDDLSLQLAGSRDGLYIQGYFSPGTSAAAQQWQIRLPDESNTPLADVIGEVPQVLHPLDVQTLFDDFIVRAQASRRSELMMFGYRPQSDGSFLKEETVEVFGATLRELTTEHLLDTVQVSEAGGIVRGPERVTVSMGVTSRQDTVSYQEINTSGATFVSFRAGGNHPAAAGAGAAQYFNLGGGGYSGVAYSGVQVGVYGPTSSVNPLAAQSGVSERNIVGFYTFPSGAPSYIQRDNQPHTTQETTLVVNSYFEQIQAGASDNAIRTRRYSVVDAGAGNDTVIDESGGYPGALGSLLYGGPGNDVLNGGDADDLLAGGTGEDRLYGGGGNDTYVLFDGDGADVVFDSGVTQPGTVRENVLDLPASATPEALTVTPIQLLWLAEWGFSLHSALELAWGSDDRVTIVLPHSDLNAGTGIDALRFSDGARLSMVDLAAGLSDPHEADNDLALESSLYGGGGNDVLHGSGTLIGGEGSDLLIGSALGDTLYGGDGVITGIGLDFPIVGAMWDVGDVYRGGAGNDLLWATAGSDVFELQAGDGTDTVTDVYHSNAYQELVRGEGRLLLEADARDPAHRAAMLEGRDTLRFGAGILPQDIIVRRGFLVPDFSNGDALVFAHANGTDAIWFENWYAYARPDSSMPVVNQLSRVEFIEDGTVWDRATIETLAAAATRQIDGTDSDDFLFGSVEGELIYGNAGNDYLAGSAGEDVLDGGAGDDIYFFQAGDGADVIQESGIGTFDVVSFGFGITPEMLVLQSGSLLIRIGDQGDAIHIEDFDADSSVSSIEGFRFANGDTLSLAQLLARGFDIDGSFEDDILGGTSVQDRMEGFGGDDILESGAGDDRLDGGSGNDVLKGGTGSDTYVFSSFSGLDRIEDSGGSSDVLELGAGITTGATTVQMAGNFMRLSFGGSRGEVSIRWQPDEGYGVEAVEFFSGAVWDAATLESMAIFAPNAAPFVARAPFDRVAQEDEVFSFQLASDTFLDPGDALTYRATLADGTPIPQWLAFNASAAAFMGTPDNDDVGTVNVRVTATDMGNLSAFTTFQLRVANTNDAPLLVNSLMDQSAVVGAAFGYTVAAGAFADIDAGDTLALRASRSDGSELPAWLTFDPVTRSFGGTPMPGDIAVLDVEVTAADSFDLKASGVFRLSVTEGPVDGGSEGGIPGGAIDGAPGPGVLESSSFGDELAGVGGGLSLAGQGENEAVPSQNDNPEMEEQSSEDSADAFQGTLAAFLVQTAHSDFTEAARELENASRSGDVLTAVQIARQWDAVARYGERLAMEADENARGAAAIDWHPDQLLLGGEVGPAFGRGGVAGVGQGAANLQVLKGLAEGFQRLRN